MKIEKKCSGSHNYSIMSAKKYMDIHGESNTTLPSIKVENLIVHVVFFYNILLLANPPLSGNHEYSECFLTEEILRIM